MKRLVLEDFIPYRLNRLAAAISQQLRVVYDQTYDLTVPEWRVLATLGEFDHLTAKAIGAHSAMHKTKVSRAVRGLEERRWLARTENSSDRREEFLELTKAGREAYAAVLPDMTAFESALCDTLGPEETAIVLRALDNLERALAIRA